MKRILSLLLCIILLLCCWGCQEKPPSNNDPSSPPSSDYEILVTEDGIRYRNEQRIDHIYLEGDTIHYTFVNETDREPSVGPYSISVEKWENGNWIYYPLLSGISRETAAILRAQSNLDAKHSISPKAVTPGKYRLVEGYERHCTNMDGSVYLARSDEYLYWIGEFTVTEEQAATYPDRPGDLYYGAGAYQSKNVTLTLSAVEHSVYHFEFSLKNNGDKNLILPINNNKTYAEGDPIIDQHAYAERWDEEKECYTNAHWWQRLPEADTAIAPGEALRLPFCSDDPNTSTDRYEIDDGYYRYFVTCYWEGDTENIFCAVIFFRITNGAIS